MEICYFQKTLNGHGLFTCNKWIHDKRSTSVHTDSKTSHWRHNDHDGVSNHQPHDYLLNRLFGRGSKKTSKLRVTGLCAGNSPGPVNSPHKGPVARKIFPFDDVIMTIWIPATQCHAIYDTSLYLTENITWREAENVTTQHCKMVLFGTARFCWKWTVVNVAFRKK